MKAVLMSARPIYCEWIETEDKNVMVTKTRPNMNTFKVYIYCTKCGNLLYKSNNNNTVFLTHKKYRDSILRDNHIELNGKVIGEFICNQINEYTEADLLNNKCTDEYPCMSDDELLAYKGKNKVLYFWRISDLIIYDNPKELSEFYRHDTSYDNSFGGYFEDRDERTPITRPPQSWCYVEGV